MSAPMPQQLYICESAGTCDGPENCDHRKPHPGFFLPGKIIKLCHDYPLSCFFVSRPVSCIPFNPASTHTQRSNRQTSQRKGLQQ